MIQKTSNTKINNMRLLVIACISLSLGLVVSCTKNKGETSSDQVVLNSFGPTGSKIGDTLRFIGQNLQKVTSIKFTGDSAKATLLQSDFKQQTSEEIKVLVPPGAEKGYVTLKTPEGNIVTKTQLNLSVTTTVTTMTTTARHGDNVTLNGTYLNWVNGVTFEGGTKVTTFVSQAANQLVLKVPGDAKNGPLQVSYGGTDSSVIITKDTLKILIPSITNMTPNPIDTSANLTITGANLDLVSSVAFANVNTPVTNFVSQAANQLVVKVPPTALRGKITLAIKNSTLKVVSANELVINSLPPLADFTAPIYTDATQSGFQDWSYTDTHDFNSTEMVRQGSKSIKAVYGGNGYQGITFHNPGTGLSTTGYTNLEFSVYADAASNGKKLQVVTNGAYSGAVPQVTLVGGSWTTFTVPLSSMGGPTNITEIVIQGANFLGTVYIDHVGLR
jgi:hypothetical protein